MFAVTFLTVKTVLSFTVTTVDDESTAEKEGFKNCNEFLRHKTTMINPYILK